MCKQPTATYQMVVDHVDPIIPVTTALEHMSADDLIDRIWCEPKNLLAICKPCHKIKTKAETAERTKNKRKKRNERQ